MTVARDTEKFPKSARLRKRPEFLKLSRQGRRTFSTYFVIISGKNPYDEPRLGITVNGKVGNAVVRNRIKRAVREIFRRRRHSLESGLDLLVIARKGASEATPRQIAQDMIGTLNRLTDRRN